MIDVAPERMREAEGDIGLVAVFDHRSEQPVELVPYALVVGKRGEGRLYSRAVLGDVLAVKTEPLLADPDGGLRIHYLEGAFGSVRVLAQFAVKIIEDGQNELGCCRNPAGNIVTSMKIDVALFDR
jgi:hypothetical protein